MMKHEFEKLAGYEVTNEDYNNIIEPMYMALPDVTKQEFVKMIDRKRFALPTKAQVVKKMKDIAKHLAEICGRYTDWQSRDELNKIAREYAKRFLGLDWTNDTNVWVIFIDEYEFPELRRGCTYPANLLIGYKDRTYEDIQLV